MFPAIYSILKLGWPSVASSEQKILLSHKSLQGALCWKLTSKTRWVLLTRLPYLMCCTLSSPPSVIQGSPSVLRWANEMLCFLKPCYLAHSWGWRTTTGKMVCLCINQLVGLVFESSRVLNAAILFSQGNTPTHTHPRASNNQISQQVVDEISALKRISGATEHLPAGHILKLEPAVFTEELSPRH